MNVEHRTTVEQSEDGTWLWIGSVTSRHRDGSLASYVSRWGAAGLTEAAARKAATEWLDTFEDVPGHAVPGLGGIRHGQ